MRSFLWVLSAVFLMAQQSVSASPLLKGGTMEASNYEDALAVECPQPELPAEHSESGGRMSCVARFTIEADGKFIVRLLNSTGSQEVDDLALATLKKWKFKPAQLDGKPIKSSRKIKIEFEVE
ncbi:MAG: energy transducer TonB [Candidatus Obscuribacterales bacterium]|nr:energy transducer TonB [Candidatus Obscuribacterales bacterium]